MPRARRWRRSARSASVSASSSTGRSTCIATTRTASASIFPRSARGSFLGELAQLAGRPSFGDAVASEPVKALIFSPDRMRALLIAEAELGERLMRALILRRTQMLQDGVGGPVIVGRSENPNVIRLEGFLPARTPRMHLDPETDPEAKALIDRFHVFIRGNCRS